MDIVFASFMPTLFIIKCWWLVFLIILQKNILLIIEQIFYLNLSSFQHQLWNSFLSSNKFLEKNLRYITYLSNIVNKKRFLPCFRQGISHNSAWFNYSILFTWDFQILGIHIIFCNNEHTRVSKEVNK